MADKPILFSGPMVRALLAGTKTQTRREIKPRPWNAEGDCVNIDAAKSADYGIGSDGRAYFQFEHPLGGPLTAYVSRIAVGDRLYVRETWSHTGTGVWTIADTWNARDGQVIYQADNATPGAKYWPSIHMPRRYSRLTLTVTDVRVERLQDISEADAQAEGIERMKDFFGCPCWKDYTDYGDGEPAVCPDDPVGSYHSLWDSINGAGAWAANPWVAAYTFTVERGNIDQLRAAS